MQREIAAARLHRLALLDDRHRHARLGEPQRRPRARRARSDDDDPRRRASRRPARQRRGRGRRRERLALPRDQHAQPLAQRAALARIQRAAQHAQRARLSARPAERAFQTRPRADRPPRRAGRTDRPSQACRLRIMARAGWSRATPAWGSGRRAGGHPGNAGRPPRIRGTAAGGSRNRAVRRAQRGLPRGAHRGGVGDPFRPSERAPRSGTLRGGSRSAGRGARSDPAPARSQDRAWTR